MLLKFTFAPASAPPPVVLVLFVGSQQGRKPIYTTKFIDQLIIFLHDIVENTIVIHLGNRSVAAYEENARKPSTNTENARKPSTNTYHRCVKQGRHRRN
ncbi:hypothetical protein Scep_017130 [Stephania cephalantha]|uniref:Uncharacterized protein n=1 Tax=Stephania cephalantha TaxID=152367 RepID=A0AAP0IP26_9MAGN